MKTLHFYYLAKFLSEWQIFPRKVLEKIKTCFMVNNFFRTWYLVRGNVEKYGTDKQAIDDNIIRTVHFICVG